MVSTARLNLTKFFIDITGRGSHPSWTGSCRLLFPATELPYPALPSPPLVWPTASSFQLVLGPHQPATTAPANTWCWPAWLQRRGVAGGSWSPMLTPCWPLDSLTWVPGFAVENLPADPGVFLLHLRSPHKLRRQGQALVDKSAVFLWWGH